MFAVPFVNYLVLLVSTYVGVSKATYVDSPPIRLASRTVSRTDDESLVRRWYPFHSNPHVFFDYTMALLFGTAGAIVGGYARLLLGWFNRSSACG